jgi:hypothetical protein
MGSRSSDRRRYNRPRAGRPHGLSSHDRPQAGAFGAPRRGCGLDLGHEKRRSIDAANVRSCPLSGHGPRRHCSSSRDGALAPMALTGAERMARLRERQRAGEKPVRKDRRSRPQQWQEAVRTLLDCLEAYQDWQDNLRPEWLTAPLLNGSMPSLSCTTWSSWRRLNYPVASAGIDAKHY